MIRKVFTLSVNPGCTEEYERRHSPIWPELTAVLREHGVEHYTIHVDEATGLLVGVADIQSEERWAAIAQTEVCQKWWAHMADIMPTNPDHSPQSTELKPVFKLGE